MGGGRAGEAMSLRKRTSAPKWGGGDNGTSESRGMFYST